MSAITLYQVDAFTDRLFSGNPAAVCILDEWLDDTVMQAIAAENNLSETAFAVPRDSVFEIRWFTPTVEVALCGHATLATAYVLFNIIGHENSGLRFHSHRSGPLKVMKKESLLFLDFPTDVLENVDRIAAIADCIGIEPLDTYKGKTDYIAVLNREQDLITLQPDMKKIAALDARGLIVTAKGSQVDFVSRFFAPQSGVDEDPVTGSAHTSLIPLWSAALKKEEMTAKQLSKRGGQLICIDKGDRSLIGGTAVLYMKGELHID